MHEKYMARKSSHPISAINLHRNYATPEIDLVILLAFACLPIIQPLRHKLYHFVVNFANFLGLIFNVKQSMFIIMMDTT